MQRSESNPPASQGDSKMDGKDFAVLVESLYVANLLILPVLAFIILALIFLKKHGSLPALADSHLEQTMSASIWIGVFFFITALTVMLMNLVGIEDVTLWMTCRWKTPASELSRITISVLATDANQTYTALALHHSNRLLYAIRGRTTAGYLSL